MITTPDNDTKLLPPYQAFFKSWIGELPRCLGFMVRRGWFWIVLMLGLTLSSWWWGRAVTLWELFDPLILTGFVLNGLMTFVVAGGLAVGWIRAMLTGEGETTSERLIVDSLVLKYVWYALWLAVLFLLLWSMTFSGVLVALSRFDLLPAGVFDLFWGQLAVAMLALVTLPLALYIPVRWSLSLVAIALEIKGARLSWSWGASKGGGWWLVGCVMIPVLLTVMILLLSIVQVLPARLNLSQPPAAHALLNVVSVGVLVVAVAMFAHFLSLAYDVLARGAAVVHFGRADGQSPRIQAKIMDPNNLE